MARRRPHSQRWRRWCRSSERGATLVEAAFIFPVLVLLTFGFIEYGLVFKDYLTISNTTRAGARVASADGKTALADYDILQAVQSSGAALGNGNLDYIVVYKASADNGKLPAGCDTASVSGKCNRYTLNAFALAKTKFGQCTVNDTGTKPDSAWCPNARANREVDNSGAGPDYIGVYVHATHPYLTKMFGSSLTLTDWTVMRIEPVL